MIVIVELFFFKVIINMYICLQEAAANTLVAVEVVCWFYIGECIGKRALVGYHV